MLRGLEPRKDTPIFCLPLSWESPSPVCLEPLGVPDPMSVGLPDIGAPEGGSPCAVHSKAVNGDQVFVILGAWRSAASDLPVFSPFAQEARAGKVTRGRLLPGSGTVAMAEVPYALATRCWDSALGNPGRWAWARGDEGSGGKVSGPCPGVCPPHLPETASSEGDRTRKSRGKRSSLS